MIFWNDQSSIQRLHDALKQDQIILASGDTVLGLWGNVTLASFYALNCIKQRNDKPYLITIDSLSKLSKFTDQPLTDSMQMLMQTCWPGPVTLIFQARSDLPDWMTGQDRTIALRVPDHDGLQQLLTYFDGLFSTSANVAGQSVVNCIDQVDASIISKVSAICIDSGQECYSISPSTILDCSSGKIEIIRSGAYNIENLKHFLT
jgi:L-threonylcarbamoyladenylate synthase